MFKKKHDDDDWYAQRRLEREEMEIAKNRAREIGANTITVGSNAALSKWLCQDDFVPTTERLFGNVVGKIDGFWIALADDGEGRGNETNT